MIRTWQFGRKNKIFEKRKRYFYWDNNNFFRKYIARVTIFTKAEMIWWISKSHGLIREYRISVLRKYGQFIRILLFRITGEWQNYCHKRMAIQLRSPERIESENLIGCICFLNTLFHCRHATLWRCLYGWKIKEYDLNIPIQRGKSITAI